MPSGRQGGCTGAEYAEVRDLQTDRQYLPERNKCHCQTIQVL